MFHRLLVPLDGSPADEQALTVANSIARASGAVLELELMFARDAAEKICAHAVDVRADLIVMTSGGGSALGSVAPGVLHRSTIPVLLLRATETPPYEASPWPTTVNVLVPLDGSESAPEVIPPAAALALSTKGRLLLLKVVQPAPLASMDLETAFVAGRPGRDDAITQNLTDAAEQYLAAFATDLSQHGQAGVETHVVFAENIAEGIMQFARQYGVNVVAMSTHGQGRSNHTMGGIADDVCRDCNLPMLLRRPSRVPGIALFGSAPVAEGRITALAHA